MGILTAQVRTQYLRLYESDLQFKIQMITQTKLNLSANINDLVNIGTDLDPDSPELKLLEQRRQKLKMVEDNLDAMIERYKVQLQAVQAEKQSADKYLQDGLKVFSY